MVPSNSYNIQKARTFLSLDLLYNHGSGINNIAAFQVPLLEKETRAHYPQLLSHFHPHQQ